MGTATVSRATPTSRMEKPMEPGSAILLGIMIVGVMIILVRSL
jgi:hypothetical protein